MFLSQLFWHRPSTLPLNVVWMWIWQTEKHLQAKFGLIVLLNSTPSSFFLISDLLIHLCTSLFIVCPYCGTKIYLILNHWYDANEEVSTKNTHKTWSYAGLKMEVLPSQMIWELAHWRYWSDSWCRRVKDPHRRLKIWIIRSERTSAEKIMMWTYLHS